MTYICIDTRECFARLSKKKCQALSVTYEHDGECPFCKKEKNITNGKYYPFYVQPTKKPR